MIRRSWLWACLFGGGSVLAAPEKKIGWQTGKATTNQCPVCGTMAAPYKTVPQPPRSVEHIVRCKRCNAAFWQ